MGEFVGMTYLLFSTQFSILMSLMFRKSFTFSVTSTIFLATAVQPISRSNSPVGVPPFKTLHALYLSGLCQRVSLICKNLVYIFSADRHPFFIVNVGIYTHFEAMLQRTSICRASVTRRGLPPPPSCSEFQHQRLARLQRQVC